MQGFLYSVTEFEESAGARNVSLFFCCHDSFILVFHDCIRIDQNSMTLFSIMGNGFHKFFMTMSFIMNFLSNIIIKELIMIP